MKKHYAVVNGQWQIDVYCDRVTEESEGFYFFDSPSDCSSKSVLKGFAPKTSLIEFQEPKPVVSTKYERRFAYLPKIVLGKFYWLEWYNEEII